MFVTRSVGTGPTTDRAGHRTAGPVTLSLLPGETATVYATKAGDPGFTDFAWRQDGLDVRTDGHAAEVTAQARPGSYDIVVDAGDGPDGTVHVAVRAPGQTADVDARQDVLAEGGAVRSARRPTTGGLYIPEIPADGDLLDGRGGAPVRRRVRPHEWYVECTHAGRDEPGSRLPQLSRYSPKPPTAICSRRTVRTTPR